MHIWNWFIQFQCKNFRCNALRIDMLKFTMYFVHVPSAGRYVCSNQYIEISINQLQCYFFVFVCPIREHNTKIQLKLRESIDMTQNLHVQHVYWQWKNDFHVHWQAYLWVWRSAVMVTRTILHIQNRFATHK